MSEKVGVECDGCGKISFDWMKDKWIVIEGGITKYGGRDKHNHAFTELYLPTGTVYHFCCWDCLMNKAKKKKK